MNARLLLELTGSLTSGLTHLSHSLTQFKTAFSGLTIRQCFNPSSHFKIVCIKVITYELKHISQMLYKRWS